MRYPSGVMEISFSDGSVKKISSDGSEDIKFPDGTHVVVEANGDRSGHYQLNLYVSFLLKIIDLL